MPCESNTESTDLGADEGDGRFRKAPSTSDHVLQRAAVHKLEQDRDETLLKVAAKRLWRWRENAG